MSIRKLSEYKVGLQVFSNHLGYGEITNIDKDTITIKYGTYRTRTQVLKKSDIKKEIKQKLLLEKERQEKKRQEHLRWEAENREAIKKWEAEFKDYTSKHPNWLGDLMHSYPVC